MIPPMLCMHTLVSTRRCSTVQDSALTKRDRLLALLIGSTNQLRLELYESGIFSTRERYLELELDLIGRGHLKT